MGAGIGELAVTPIDLSGEEGGRAKPETADWVRRAREGDRVAFDLLVRRHEEWSSGRRSGCRPGWTRRRTRRKRPSFAFTST